MVHTEFLKQFEWISVERIPEWSAINDCAKYLIDRSLFDPRNHQQLFIEFSLVKAYFNEEKVKQLNEKKIKSEERWTLFFRDTKLETSNSCDSLATLVSFLLTLPGM